MARSTGSPIYRITTARKSVPDDQAARVRGYVISMSIRIVCFVLGLADLWSAALGVCGLRCVHSLPGCGVRERWTRAQPRPTRHHRGEPARTPPLTEAPRSSRQWRTWDEAAGGRSVRRCRDRPS